jgi:Glycosyl transferase family 2
MTRPSPRVSIITATYNRSNVLRYAIESALWQTFPDFEMLVIGDGCTDDSAEVVASFGDSRLQWQNLAQNSGNQSLPNNAGLEIARGKFIAYLGHDDIWLPHHLEILSQKLETTGADLAYSWLEMIEPPETGFRTISGITSFGDFEPDAPIPPTSLMHTAALWREIGPWKDYRTITLPTDQEFVTRAFERGKRIVSVKQLSALKFSSTSRPNCYVEKPCHEQAEYVRHIKSECDFLATELTAVIESIMLRHPEEIPRVSVSGMRPGEIVTQSRVLRGLEKPAFPAPPVGRIDLSSSKAGPFLAQGWSAPEAGFRWTDGKTATLLFGLSKPPPRGLQLELAPFIVSGKLPEQTIQLRLNDEEIGRWSLTEKGVVNQTIALPQSLLREENRLDFGLPNASSPRELRLSLDIRRLALKVHWLQFVFADELATEPAPNGASNTDFSKTLR